MVVEKKISYESRNHLFNLWSFSCRACEDVRRSKTSVWLFNRWPALDPSIDRPEKNGPSQSIIERYIQLKGSKHVDEIVPYVSEQDLEDILRSFKLDIRIIGDEYKEKNFTGRTYCEEKGIELYYNSRDHRFSSSGLRKQVKLVEDK